MRDASPCGASSGRERAARDVVPLALQAPRVARTHLHGLADLAEELLGLPVLARLLEQQGIPAARLLARVIGRERRILMERRFDLTLLLHRACVEQMALRGLEIRVGVALRVEHPLDLREVAARELGAGKAMEESGISRMEARQRVPIECRCLVGPSDLKVDVGA